MNDFDEQNRAFKHRGGYKYRNRRQMNISKRNTFWTSLITTALGLIIKDITSEQSKLKFITRKLISSKQQKNNQQTPIETEYEIINDEEKI